MHKSSSGCSPYKDNPGSMIAIAKATVAVAAAASTVITATAAGALYFHKSSTDLCSHVILAVKLLRSILLSSCDHRQTPHKQTLHRTQNYQRLRVRQTPHRQTLHRTQTYQRLRVRQTPTQANSTQNQSLRVTQTPHRQTLRRTQSYQRLGMFTCDFPVQP